MDAFGKTLLLRLTPNKEFLSRSFQTMTLGGDGRVVDLSGSTGACFYSGTVESFERSSVVLSTCSGLQPACFVSMATADSVKEGQLSERQGSPHACLDKAGVKGNALSGQPCPCKAERPVNRPSGCRDVRSRRRGSLNTGL
ncbi:A disintegrin and metalloproteinase with thrombospondin motifs 19 [Branchiostoma belcheri]|nr:A disintegrin and metalloproteinase with thrombospondin motifs 19 [Branchiostoma belcheri]